MGLCLWPEVTNWALIWSRGHNKTEAAELELKGQHVCVAVQYCRGNYSGWVYPSTSQQFLLLLDMRVFLIFIFYKYCVGAPSNLQISTYTSFLFLFYKNPKIIYDSKMIRWVTSRVHSVPVASICHRAFLLLTFSSFWNLFPTRSQCVLVTNRYVFDFLPSHVYGLLLLKVFLLCCSVASEQEMGPKLTRAKILDNSFQNLSILL